MSEPIRIPPGPGQESVWDYPRPPRVELTESHIQVVFNGVVVADTHAAQRVLETSHPPVYYIPPQDVRSEFLITEPGASWCEWKGQAHYLTVKVGDRWAERAAWSFVRPRPDYDAIRRHIAFYAGLMDRCTVDGEVVRPQPGPFYGGWITDQIVGPFKGEEGTWNW